MSDDSTSTGDDGYFGFKNLINGVSDHDGNYYKVVTFGTQIWMAENLKTTRYNDGTIVPLITDNNVWKSSNTHGYCWYDDAPTNGDIYGALYNWYAVNTGKLCPSGWHLPTNAEWTALTDYLGGTGIASGKLKETGITHWPGPNDGTNESGFTALPGGYRNSDGFLGPYGPTIGTFGAWWSSTEHLPGYADDRWVTYDTAMCSLVTTLS